MPGPLVPLQTVPLTPAVTLPSTKPRVPSAATPAWQRTCLDAGVFILLLSSAGLLWNRPWLLITIYAAISCYLLVSRWSAETVAYFLVGFLLGPIAEFYAVKNGAWIYSGVDHILPLWLPMGWGISGILLKAVGDVFTTLMSRWV